MSEFKPYIEYYNVKTKKTERLGEIGKPTPYTDSDGKPLFIGDKVITKRSFANYGETIMIESDGEIGTLGMVSSFKESIKDNKEFTFTKTVSFENLKDNEIIKIPKAIIDKKNETLETILFNEILFSMLGDKEIITIRLTPKQVDFSKLWKKSKTEEKDV